MSSYCEAIAEMKPGIREVHREYHDKLYGFPVKDDRELFCRLVLEINQAGLSWTTILKKEQNFRKAFHSFEIGKVASFGKRDINRLLADEGIIRNRLKIEAAIHNARVIQQLQQTHGSFKKWLDHHHPMEKQEWVKLFRNTFRFTGGEIVNEFLVSTGYLPGAHHRNCIVYKRILGKKPRWMDSQPSK